MSPPRTAVVLLAGGSGSRVGAAQNKVLLPLSGRAVLVWSVDTVLGLEHVHRLVVVVRPADRTQIAAILAPVLGGHEAWLVDGGATRHASETSALAALRPDIDAGEVDLVVMHDAARPLASLDLWRRTIAAASQSGGAVPALPLHGALATAGGGPLEDLVAVQTPQAFDAAALLTAYDAAGVDGFTGTDTASCLEQYTELCTVTVPGEPGNVKITFPADLPFAEELIRRRAVHQKGHQTGR